jgi:shikimate dehydrogenase
MSDHYAVIGNPISQTKSPFIHACYAKACDQQMHYTALEGPLGHFAEAVDAFRAAGGRGLSVTVPFKMDACAYATSLSERARLAGAVNALKFDGDEVLGDNFDGMGLVRDVTHNLGLALRGKRVLLLGAGGAVRGALLPFIHEQPASLTIANRTLSKAVTLAAEVAGHATVNACSYEALAGQPFDLVFNAPSASFRGELPPVPATAFAPGCLAYELAYGKGLTPFLRLAQASGAGHLADGVGMLAEQAAEAFAWWRGPRPETQAVIAQLSVPLV